MVGILPPLVNFPSGSFQLTTTLSPKIMHIVILLMEELKKKLFKGLWVSYERQILWSN